jgi:cephalosporin-C deacetylase-like acetyl esterase
MFNNTMFCAFTEKAAIMKSFFSLAFLAGCLSLGAAEPPQPDVTSVNYTDDGFQLQGYLSLPDVTPAPAVVILPDWDGVNFYEQQRATMIAKELGYVGFAADIYGADKHEVEDIDERRALATLYRSNSTLFTSRINAAVDTVKALSDVDSDNVAVIGYCFGGTLYLCFQVASVVRQFLHFCLCGPFFLQVLV